ncbi:MAG: FecR domain-containing protein [Parasphingorhabdus sp.]|nr:FecR domain-containing protein [Parasphingorhabdus sp.]
MPAITDRAMVEQAIAWYLRLKDADEDAWIEFAEWLDADPAHNAAYEAVTDRDAHMSTVLEKATFPSGVEHQPQPQFSNDEDSWAYGVRDEGPSRTRWRWGALAASIVVAGLFGLQMFPGWDSTYPIETAVGETRTVSLADGSEIRLNGSTRIVLDKSDARLVEIARGEARFTVERDKSDPFTVIAGEHRLVDIGTVFNVVRTDRQFRVGVAEGAVRFEGMARTVELRAGDSLAADNSGRIEISQRPITAIGSWADGVLVYDQAPLEQVADDLSRSIGVSLEFPRGMGATRFSGVIQTDGAQDIVRTRLEELIGKKIVADGTRWSVETR